MTCQQVKPRSLDVDDFFCDFLCDFLYDEFEGFDRVIYEAANVFNAVVQAKWPIIWFPEERRPEIPLVTLEVWRSEVGLGLDGLP